MLKGVSLQKFLKNSHSGKGPMSFLAKWKKTTELKKKKHLSHKKKKKKKCPKSLNRNLTATSKLRGIQAKN